MIQEQADLLAVKDNNGQIPLHLACFYGRTQVAKMLIGERANLEATDSSYRTPLHLASLEGKLEVVRLLIIKRANPN